VEKDIVDWHHCTSYGPTFQFLKIIFWHLLTSISLKTFIRKIVSYLKTHVLVHMTPLTYHIKEINKGLLIKQYFNRYALMLQKPTLIYHFTNIKYFGIQGTYLKTWVKVFSEKDSSDKNSSWQVALMFSCMLKGT
jgi:hypothetical protein